MVKSAALFVLFLPFVLTAQGQHPAFVRASGEAVITAKPDRAEITIGVMTRAATAQEAAAQNASQSTKVIDAIKQTLGSAGEIKTSGYSLSPQYEYPQGHAPKLVGYESSNTVDVTVDELPRLAKVIDAATNTGANQINGISFTLKDDSAVRERALSEAAVKARANAEALAKALNVQVVRLLQAEPTESPIVRPQPIAFARAMEAKVATPVEAGSLNVRASVTVTLEVH